MDDRAGAGRGGRRTRQLVRRRPPQRPGALLPERPDARAAAGGVGLAPGRRAVPAAVVAPGARGRTDRHARVDRAAAGSSCSARSAAATEQFAAFGLAEKQRRSRFEASLDVDPPAVRGRRGVDASRRVEIERARIAPVPPEPLEVWIGASAPPAIDRAARLGDAFLVGPEATPTEARELIAVYQERVRSARRAAVDDRDPPRHPRRRRRRRRRAGRGADPRRAATGASTPTAPVVGGPARSPRAFAELAGMGYTDVIVRHLADDQARCCGPSTAAGRSARERQRRLNPAG